MERWCIAASNGVRFRKMTASPATLHSSKRREIEFDIDQAKQWELALLIGFMVAERLKSVH